MNSVQPMMGWMVALLYAGNSSFVLGKLVGTNGDFWLGCDLGRVKKCFDSDRTCYSKSNVRRIDSDTYLVRVNPLNWLGHLSCPSQSTKLTRTPILSESVCSCDTDDIISESKRALTQTQTAILSQKFTDFTWTPISSESVPSWEMDGILSKSKGRLSWHNIKVVSWFDWDLTQMLLWPSQMMILTWIIHVQVKCSCLTLIEVGIASHTPSP